MSVLKHYGTKGMHWYVRNYQFPNGTLTPLGRVRYLKNARKEAQNVIAKKFSGAVARRQKKRYLDWSRSENEWIHTKNQNTTKKRINSRKSEAKDFMPAMKEFFGVMRDVSSKHVDYNEDLLGMIWSEEYKKAIIDPALKSYDRIVSEVKKLDASDPDYASFLSDKGKMKRYGYSDELAVSASEDGMDMKQYAYVNYLIKKGKVEI